MDKEAQFYEKINQHLREVAARLALFIENVLSSLFDDWWSKAVINTLSFQQKKRLEQKKHYFTKRAGPCCELCYAV